MGAPAEPASQEESFTAWRRFLEGLAVKGPTVLVFEDLHWADEALLSFLEHLADWSQGVPLLVLCTARPELQEAHPGWAAGLRNATTINLAPLSDEETARLIGSLLERAVLPAETQRALLERAGGNPLYAEEFVRLLADRGALAETEEVEVPDSVQALIAARLDTLSPERKSLLQDAAVVGKVFWAGALAEMGGRELARGRAGAARAVAQGARAPLAYLGDAGRGRVRLLAPAGQGRLLRQIPRAARAARHRSAAAWLEHQAGERAEDLADVLAYHYLTALELARAAGQAEQAEELEANAIRYLALAGERALALDVERAEASLARALALAPAGHPERASLLERWAQAATQQGRLQETRAALEEALALYRQQDASVAAGRALTALASVLGRLGDPRQEETLAQALELLEAQPPGPELVAAYAQLAGSRLVGGAYREAIAAAEQALALAAELGLPEPARALGHAGCGPRLPGGAAGARGHAPSARARGRAGPGPRRGRPAQQPRARPLAVRGAAGRPRCLPGGDRLLRAARHRRVRARHRRHEHALPRRMRPRRAGVSRGRPAGRAPGERPATSTPSSRAPCSCACSAERGRARAGACRG